VTLAAEAEGTVDVLLRDGTALRLRGPDSSDEAGLLEFFARLSDQSRYFRFHGVESVRSALVRPFLEPDWVDRGHLLATVADDGRERVVALGTYARLRDPATAEVALAVADDFHGRGIGTRLIEQLSARAAQVGIEQFVAEVMAGNSKAMNVFRDAGFDIARHLEDGVFELRFSIAPSEQYLARVDERDHVAVTASLRPFFDVESVAVVGASPRRGSIGGELFRNILRGDFAGAAYPVNRDGVPVAGVRAYTSIESVPDAVDLAVICTPADLVLDAAKSALRKGVRALCVISAGFAETGRDGLARQERLLEAVRSYGARLVGPNCLGIFVASARLNATFAARDFRAGSIGFSSQSGALGLALLEHAAERGLGFANFVSIGNKADVSTNDLLEFWEDDEATDVAVLYVESFGNPRRFARIARRVARRKPILAMKSGATRAGARAAGSHTAALAGSETAVDALFEQAGILRARNLEELVDAAVLFSTQPLPDGRRVAVLTNAGGLGILCADACEAAGLELPELGEQTRDALARLLPREASLTNPIDMLGSATAELYEQVLPIVARDPRVDAVIALFVPPVVADAESVAAAIARGASAAGKPVLASVVAEGGIPRGLIDAGVAAFPYPESAAHALGLAARRAEWLRRPLGTPLEPDGIDRAAARAVVQEALERGSEAWLTPADVRPLLDAYGLPLVPERPAADPDAAVAAAQELGFPVVVKTAAAGAHKTETGGVALDLQDADAVRTAASRIGGEVLVQPMVEGGIELLAGVTQDPMFGPLVGFGLGGVLAELLGDVHFRLAPLSDVDADEMIGAGAAGRLVRGFRGAPAADEHALRDLLGRLSRLGEDFPELAELDLNPVIASPDGCVVVDARVRVARPPQRTNPKTW
jgi:acetyl coenzyme A synthetase (ADP forming)-like protein